MFEDHYRKANDSIPVNQELLEKLKETAKHPERTKRYPVRWASAVVAAAVLGVTLFTFADLKQFGPQPVTPSASPDQKIEQRIGQTQIIPQAGEDVQQNADVVENQLSNQASSVSSSQGGAVVSDPAPAEASNNVDFVAISGSGEEMAASHMEVVESGTTEYVAPIVSNENAVVDGLGKPEDGMGEVGNSDSASVPRTVDQTEDSSKTEEMSGTPDVVSVQVEPAVSAPFSELPGLEAENELDVNEQNSALEQNNASNGEDSCVCELAQENDSEEDENESELSSTPETTCSPSPETQETPAGEEELDSCEMHAEQELTSDLQNSLQQ